MLVPSKRRKLISELSWFSDVIRRDTEAISREYIEGGTWGDIEVLGVIYFEYDGVARPSNLVGFAYSTSAGVTGSLRRLEAAGLVERERIEEDRRVLLVKLTDRGRAAIVAAIPAYSALADKRLSELSDDQVDWLIEFVQQQADL